MFCLNSFTQPLVEILKRHPKRVVFPEGEDLRVLEVAAWLVKQEAVVPILLGSRARIREMAEQHGIKLTFVKIIDPASASDLELFCERYERIERLRGNKQVDAGAIMQMPHYFAAMMVQYGQADAMVAGNQVSSFTVFRAISRLIKPLADVSQYFGVSSVVMPSIDADGQVNGERVLYLADTCVSAEPSIEQLAMIAVKTGKLAAHALGRGVRVAMLSSSTKGSNPGPSAEKMRSAAIVASNLANELYLSDEVQVYGEVQVDAALSQKAGNVRLGSKSANQQTADVLVFPNLDSADIALKLLELSNQVKTYGMFVHGLSAPVAQVSRLCSSEQLMGTALAAGVEAIRFHVLHPDGLAEVY